MQGNRGLGFLTVVAVLALSACGWTQAGYDAGHSSANPAELAIGPANVSTLVPSWSLPATTNSNFPTMLVHGGRVLMRTVGGIGVVDSGTGASKWSAPPSGTAPDVVALLSPIAIVPVGGRPTDLVITGEQDFFKPSAPKQGTFGELVARDAGTGAVVWRSEVGGVISGVVVDGRVLAIANHHLGDGADFSGLVGVDLASGAVQFRSSGINGGVVVAAGGRAYAETSAGAVGAVSATGCGAPDCPVLWRASFGSGTATSVVAEGRLVVFDDSGFAVFDAVGCGAATCSPLWTATGAVGGVAVANKRIFAVGSVLSGGGTAPLRAFALAGCGAPTCSAQWTSTEIGDLASPVVANGVVYAVGRHSETRAWPAAGCGSPTCASVWSVANTFPVPGAVIVADGRVLVGADALQTYVLP